MKSDKLLESTVKAVQVKLTESFKDVICYRSIGINEFDKLLSGETIKGNFSNSTEIQNDSHLDNIICFFTDKIMWKDSRHEVLIKCQFNTNEIMDKGVGQYWASKDFVNTNIWTGRKGKIRYDLEEVYVKEYSLKNVIGFYGSINETITDFLDKKFNEDWSLKYKDRLMELGYNINVLP